MRDHGPDLMRTAFGLLLCVVLQIQAARAGEPMEGFDCLITPQTMVEVGMRDEGVLGEVLVERGDIVAAGQVLARLDSAIEAATVELATQRVGMRAELAERQEHIAYTERELQRIEGLLVKKAASLTEVERARTEVTRARLQYDQVIENRQLARIELERAEAVLASRTLTSPIAGVVVERLLSPGELVENRPIMKLAQINRLHAEVVIPVDYFGRIAVGSPARVTPRYPGAAPLDVAVTLKDRTVDAASDTFGVRLSIANPDYRIPSGVRCDVRFLESGPAASPAGQ